MFRTIRKGFGTRNICIGSLASTLLISLSSSVFAQCSTAAWTAVTGTPQALGDSTIPPGLQYEQSCGLTVDATSVPAFVSTSSPTDETEVSVRFYFLADMLDITSGDVTLLRARNGGTVQFEIGLRSTGVVKHLVTSYRDSGVLAEHPDVLPIQDVWLAVEAHWAAGAGNGTFSLQLDGVEQYAVTNLTNDGEVVNEVDLGVVNNAVATGEIVFDAFLLRRSGITGLLAVNQLKNISTRADVRTVHEIVIGGFIITGDTDKCVIVRGRGPSVGVPEGEVRLPDPSLELKLGAGTLDFNDNWMDSPEADLMVILGLAPPDPDEAAIHACLPAGAYTALLRGTGGVTGIGIVEVFDADVGTPYLANISTRAPVDIGNLVAIGGFIIEGDQSKEVLIRGRGPTVGVPEGVVRLENPRLRLVDSEGTTVLINDDWGDAANAADITATGLAPSDPLEAAILITLAPGAYTAIVNGVGDNPAGVGIVEVFDRSGGSIAAQ